MYIYLSYIDHSIHPRSLSLYDFYTTSFTENIAFIQQPKQQTSLSSPDSFHTAPTSLENSPKQMPLQLEEHHVIDRRPPASVNFNDAIEHIQMRRAQEQMSIDGRDFVMLVKVSFLSHLL